MKKEKFILSFVLIFSLFVSNAIAEAATSVDNSTNKYFRGIFAQLGNSCAQASGIGYTFTYEMAYERDLDARLIDNQYPEHYTYNFLNDGKDNGSLFANGWDIAADNGVPNVTTYNGMQSPEPYIRWMSGYDKYYAGMANRGLEYFTIDVATPAGIDTLKQYLLNHLEGAPVGGIVNFSTKTGEIRAHNLADDTPHAGEKIITSFGGPRRHSMTIVGYDDTIKYDFNNDGEYTNTVDINGDNIVDVRDWEIGAVKVANTGGAIWMDNGFAWVMYRLLAHNTIGGGIEDREVWALRAKEANTVKMALKINMTHASRAKIKLSAGVSSDPHATAPEHEKEYSLFNFQGGDFPMRGDSDDPIEIGLDVSDLCDLVGEENANKFFLIIQENDVNEAYSGQIISLSLVDYTNPDNKYEYSGKSNVAIENNATTYVGVVRNSGNGNGDCIEETATNAEHVSAARAYTVDETGSGCDATTTTTYYAVGSEENLGTSASTTTTLAETSPGYWQVGECKDVDLSETVSPTVDITMPYNGETVKNMITLRANAFDNESGIGKVVFSIPDSLTCTDFQAPYNCTWNTDAVSNGSYSVTATAYDKAGNSNDSTISITVDNLVDTVPPSIYITEPSNGDTVSGNITLSSYASDSESGVDKVIFSVLGMTACIVSPPDYGCEVDSMTLPNGEYPLIATAYDNAGNSKASTPVTITIDNMQLSPLSPFEIIYPAPGDMVSGTITVRAVASDGEGNTQNMVFSLWDPWSENPQTREFCNYETNSPYECTIDTTSVPDGPYRLIVTATNGEASTEDFIDLSIFNDSTPVDETCRDWTMANSDHYNEGRASKKFLIYYAVGSGDRLGYGSEETTIREVPPGSEIFELGSCQQQ